MIVCCGFETLTCFKICLYVKSLSHNFKIACYFRLSCHFKILHQHLVIFSLFQEFFLNITRCYVIISRYYLVIISRGVVLSGYWVKCHEDSFFTLLDLYSWHFFALSHYFKILIGIMTHWNNEIIFRNVDLIP